MRPECRGREIRRYVIALAHNRAEVFRRLIAARAGTLRQPVQHRRRQRHPDRRGEVLRAVSARAGCPRISRAGDPADRRSRPTSIAGTGGVLHGRAQAGARRLDRAADRDAAGRGRGRVLIDGGATNPLPFDQLRGRADMRRRGRYFRRAGERAPRHSQSVGMPAQHAAGDGQRDHRREDQARRARPRWCGRGSAAFRALDFLQASAILRASEPVKAELKEKLAALLEK